MPYDPELIAKLRAAKTTPKTGYNPELIAQLRAKKQSEPTMWERFKAGFMGKEIPQPAGEETGRVFTPIGETAALTGAGAMMSRLAPAAAKLGYKSIGAVAVPAMGLLGGGLELGKMYEEAIKSSPGTPKTPMEALGRLSQGAYRGAAGELIGQGIGKVISKLTPSKQMLAGGVRVATGVPEKTTMQVLNDPAMLSRAKSVKDAGKAYEEALASSKSIKLQSAGPGSRVAFGKTMLPPEATLNKFDELLPIMEDGSLDLQSALSLRQTAAHHLKTAKGDWYDQPMREVLEKADDYIEKRLAGFPEAVKAYREAKIAEEFGSWLPLNKNLSPNVLRSATALAAITKGVSEGNVLPIAAASLVSPKIWGGAIRAGNILSPIAKGGTVIGSRAVGQTISEEMYPKSSEELMRKYNSKK